MAGIREDALARVKPCSPVLYIVEGEAGGDTPTLLPILLDLRTSFLRACDTHQGFGNLITGI